MCEPVFFHQFRTLGAFARARTTKHDLKAIGEYPNTKNTMGLESTILACGIID